MDVMDAGMVRPPMSPYMVCPVTTCSPIVWTADSLEQRYAFTLHRLQKPQLREPQPGSDVRARSLLVFHDWVVLQVDRL